jgi:response regulator of citrate/malate metabolism
MRNETPDIAVVVVVSAVPFEKTRDTLLKEGAMAYLIKPFNHFSFEPVRQKLRQVFPVSPT